MNGKFLTSGNKGAAGARESAELQLLLADGNSLKLHMLEELVYIFCTAIEMILTEIFLFHLSDKW